MAWTRPVRRSLVDKDDRRRFAFVVEQTLGHATHYRNMRATIDSDPRIVATWYPIGYPLSRELMTTPNGNSGALAPFVSVAKRHARRGIRAIGAKHEYDAWAAWASFRAWYGLTKDRAASRCDALYFHTQPTTLFCARLIERVPTVISLDATPRQFNSIGAVFGHQPSAAAIERLRHALYMRVFSAASAFITTSEWTRQSLIADYGVDGSRITIIPLGVDPGFWCEPHSRGAGEAVRILFVGKDFVRKGGDTLLRAFSSALGGRCELHIVTKAEVESAPGIHVYRNVEPNSDLLKRLYATADVFVLPTHADCSPNAILEAMAAGLPVVSTGVGAIREVVRDGETGFLVPPGDVPALASALGSLIDDTARRLEMGRRGQAVASENFNAAANMRRILAIMTAVSETYAKRRRLAATARA